MDKDLVWVQVDEEKLNNAGLEFKQVRNYRLIRCGGCGNEWGVSLRPKDSRILIDHLVCRNCGRHYAE